MNNGENKTINPVSLIKSWNTRYPDEDGNLRAMSVVERIHIESRRGDGEKCIRF